jgi:CDP-paratose 2-epimerase
VSARAAEGSPENRVLITGGAGFVGANLAVALADRHPEWRIVALDNLRRRGAELNLPRLRRAGVEFVHGDVREPSDLAAVGPIDALVECSAEPSVLAERQGGADYVLRANLLGAWHCIELAAEHGAQLVFLSTSRVYPIEPLRSLNIEDGPERFELVEQQVAGASQAGVSERFTLEGARTLYGATKLAAELLIAEYREARGLRAAIDRCGVIAGPWQMGKVDQGVFTHWMLSHVLGHPLTYLGYRGSGHQVRDLLHVDDLIDLVDDQLLRPAEWDGATVNVGGGREVSLSLAETTRLCREISGAEVDVGSDPQERPGDVPVYISDCSLAREVGGWAPRRTASTILEDIHEWIRENEEALAGVVAAQAGSARR